MPIEFRCISCQKLLRTPDESAGKKAKCPQCSSIVDVPLASMPPLSPLDLPGGQPEIRGSASGNPFAEGTSSGPAKTFTPSSAAANENPYATFSAPTPAPDAAWSSLSKGEPVHTLITFDEVFRRTWECFTKGVWPYALLGLITVGIPFGLKVASSILEAVAKQMGDGKVVIVLSLIFTIISAVIQIMLSAGQVLYILRLVRTGETKTSELWAGIRYTFSVLGFSIVMALLALGTLTIFALPVGAVVLAIGPQNIERNPLPVVIVGILMGLAFFGLWCWISMRLVLAYCFLVDRDRGVFGSIADSWKFTRGNVLNSFLVLVVVGALSVLFLIVTCCLGQVLSQPYLTLTTVMLYLYATGQMRHQGAVGTATQFC